MESSLSVVSSRLLFLPVKLTWPESSLSDGLQDEQLHVLDELDDDDPLELSELIPIDELISIFLVSSTKSGRCTLSSMSHFFDNFGRLRTVLCQTM